MSNAHQPECWAHAALRSNVPFNAIRLCFVNIVLAGDFLENLFNNAPGDTLQRNNGLWQVFSCNRMQTAYIKMTLTLISNAHRIISYVTPTMSLIFKPFYGEVFLCSTNEWTANNGETRFFDADNVGSLPSTTVFCRNNVSDWKVQSGFCARKWMEFNKKLIHSFFFIAMMKYSHFESEFCGRSWE